MPDLDAWVARRRRESKAAAALDARRVTPSVRDIGAVLRPGRRDLVGIPVVAPADEPSAVAVARRALAADVAALAFTADPDLGGSLAAVRAASDVLPSTPVVRLDPLVAEAQVLESRLAGADAVTLPAGFLEVDELRRLAKVVRSTMMTPLFLVRSAAEWATASEADARFVLASARGAGVSAALDVATSLPARASVCLWADGLDSAEAVRALLGRADGVLLGAAFPVGSWGEVAVVEPPG